MEIGLQPKIKTLTSRRPELHAVRKFSVKNTIRYLLSLRRHRGDFWELPRSSLGSFLIEVDSTIAVVAAAPFFVVQIVDKVHRSTYVVINLQNKFSNTVSDTHMLHQTMPSRLATESKGEDNASTLLENRTTCGDDV